MYLAIGMDASGHKHVLGTWIEQTEGAKFWPRVMNELKSRGTNAMTFAVVDDLKGVCQKFCVRARCIDQSLKTKRSAKQTPVGLWQLAARLAIASSSP